MHRFCLLILSVGCIAAPARADRISPTTQPAERALRVPIVVIGKVTAIEKGTVDAAPYPSATQKLAYHIAVVKVVTDLAGAGGATHLKVGFIPVGAGGRRGPENPTLREGEEWLFFLTKHPTGNFYAIPYMTPPLGAVAPGFKAAVADVKKVLATVADPMKALKAEKSADRFAAAIAIVYKLRTLPEGSRGGTNEVQLSASESRTILKALGEEPWKETFGRMSGYTAFARLGLTAADGWKPPAALVGQSFTEVTRASYNKWLDGPGKEYRIKKLVPKK